MTILEQSTTETITPKGKAAVRTGVARRQLVRSSFSGYDDQNEQIDGWNRHIDTISLDWMPNLESLDDGEFIPPSLSVFGRAIEIAGRFRQAGQAPPDRVVMDGDGGIIFERRSGDLIGLIQVYGEDVPSAELIGMRGGKVFFREAITASIDL